jgi:hypothetical protein
MLGGGGLVAANVYASATEGDSGGEPAQQSSGWGGTTLDCPDVGAQLTAVPDEARADVDKELALLDKQIADAYQRLQDPAAAEQQSRDAVDSEILSPLKEDRAATIERIAAAIDRVGDRPEGLDSLAACTLRESGNQAGEASGGQDDKGGDQAGGGQQQGTGQGQASQPPANGGQGAKGPVAADYADIRTAPPAAQPASPQQDASRGTFATSCGVNANGLFNSDNVIVAPGVSNGAHHFHDYVGNQANNAFASDQDLANGDTTCVDKGDKSTYYWPVLRLQNGKQEQDANSPGGGTEGNVGEIVTPKQVTLNFVGNPRSKVTAMPRLLRIITGDAKAFVNGLANANASWSCTGFEDRQLKDKYPLCPQGSDVVRTFKFQSCWDGRNIDSANHRTHVAFAQADGSCPEGFKAIPQLVQRIVYDVDAPSLEDGGRTTPLFAVDSFPEQVHKPVTDHGDFINVFDENLMQEMVKCINDGRKCGVGAGQGDGSGQGGGSGSGSGSGSGQDGGAGSGQGSGSSSGSGSGSGSGEESQQPTQAPSATAGGKDGSKPGGSGGEQTTQPATGTPSSETGGGDTSKGSGGDSPKVYSTASSSPTAASTSYDQQSDDRGDGSDNQANGNENQPSAAAAQTEPQASRGGLAETGAHLWPAAAGAVLLICGFVLLRSSRRSSR